MDTNTSGFFKESEIHTYYQNKKFVLLSNMSAARKISPISDTLYKKAYRLIDKKYGDGADDVASNQNKTEMMALDLYKLEEASTDPSFHDFLEVLGKLCKSSNVIDSNTADEKYLGINLKHGDKINLSNRNVATSRIAGLMGLNDIVAKSETVELIEPGNTKGRTGNLMQKAHGREAAKIFHEYCDTIGKSEN